MRPLIAILLLPFFISTVYGQSDTMFHPLSIGVTTQIYSSSLNEVRRINIYLPDGYNPDDTVTYPVIYIPDGGMQEDFLHLAGIVQYDTQPWVNCFRPSIVIGIENTNRQRDFTFSVNNLDFLKKTGFTEKDILQYGGSAKYISFLGNELQPFIRKHFKTIDDATIIGESLAGLLISEIYASHRELFNNYIIISPSTWWGDERLLTEIKPDNAAATKDIRVYVGVPNKSDYILLYSNAMNLEKAIQQNADKHTKVFFDYLPQETHATVIHQAVFNAFRMFYGKAQPSK